MSIHQLNKYDICIYFVGQETAVVFQHEQESPQRKEGRKRWGENEGKPVIMLLQQQDLQTQTYVVKEEEDEEGKVVFQGK